MICLAVFGSSQQGVLRSFCEDDCCTVVLRVVSFQLD